MEMNQFYFVRHGQTDHNLLEKQDKGDHIGSIPLNSTGRNQARAIEPIIRSLPIQTVCCSPMKRAQETKEILLANRPLPEHLFENFSECNARVWNGMKKWGMQISLPEDEEILFFRDKVQRGLDQMLVLPSPALIVAHGGVHWVLCSLLKIEEHPWAIDNCAIVHFSLRADGKWIAKKIC